MTKNQDRIRLSSGLVLMANVVVLFSFSLANCTPVYASTLTSSSRGEDLRRINPLKNEVDRLLINGPADAFYNYSIVCGGKAFESRGDRSFVDKTIPEKYEPTILSII